VETPGTLAGRRSPFGAVLTIVSGLVLVALGVAARCVSWKSVFAGDVIELVPADTHYYIRFALRQLAHFPHFDAFDPYVNYPTGAEIYWPVFHTWIVGGLIRLCGVHRPELGAAFVDPACAAVELVILGIVALRLFGRTTAAVMVLLYGLLPGAVFSGPLGSADHHVHEPFFVALSSVLLGRLLVRPSGALAAAVGCVIGVSRLFTPIEPLILVTVAAACVPAAWRLRKEEEGAMLPALFLWTGVGAAVPLFLTALLFGEPWSLSYERLSSFQPLLSLAAFLLVGSWAQLLRSDRRWRWSFLLAIACLAPLVPDLLRAASHFGRADPILAEVDESKHLTFAQARGMLGVGLWVTPLALIGAVRLLRRGSLTVLPALISSALLFVAAIEQFRFIQVFMGAFVVLLAIGFPAAFDGMAHARSWRPASAVAVGAALLTALIPQPAALADTEVRLVRPSLLWLSQHTPPASRDPLGDEKPEYGIVANPLIGHFLALWAERPAVATTFSQAPVHVAGNERAAKVFAAMSEDAAYKGMDETGGRYFLVTPYLKPLGHPEVDYHSSYAAELLRSAGMARPGSAHFRLLYDSPDQRLRQAGGSYVRIFEAVRGAALVGTALPDSVVSAELPMEDNLGDPLVYIRSTRADATGRFQLRVAYPSSATADSLVHPIKDTRAYSVFDGHRHATVTVSEDAVREGNAISVPGW
jgi:dolichyl-diphosphooligosaccharide--protein glycosyltransferase